MLTAKEPKKSNYSEWNMMQYEIDLRQWEENPLYGFCQKNHKPDGTPYDLYQDGLRIYTTIDSRMQQYAEAAVAEHMRDVVQPRMYEQMRYRKTPYVDLSQDKINQKGIARTFQNIRLFKLRLNKLSFYVIISNNIRKINSYFALFLIFLYFF